MPGHTKCYDHTQDALSMTRTAMRQHHRQDGVVTACEAYVEALMDDACRSARKTATFVRVGIRWFGGGSMDEGLLGQVRDCERLLDEDKAPVLAGAERQRKSEL